MDESWDAHVAPLFMGCGNSDDQGLSQDTMNEQYFNPQALLVSGQTTTTVASSASPLSGSMSPSGGSATSIGGPGTLSPGGGGGGGGASNSNQGPSSNSTTGLGPGSNTAVNGPGGGPSSNTNGSGGGGVGPSSQQCCESGRPIVTDPVTGQSVCSCQYDSARLALSQYPRSVGVGVYGTPYPSTDQNPYPSIGVDSGFYSSLSNPYALKDGSGSAEMSAWTSAGLQPTTGYYPYDPALAAYGYGAGYDLAARRKNATRESTATLKAWLNEHKKNPYPTKGEKIMLAIITKMTLTQVSTWFANARRRLKKENKMTWEPKNKTDDDDDAILSDGDDKDKDDMLDDKRDETDIHGRVKSERGNVEDDDLTDDERKDNLHHMHHMLGGGNYNLKPEMKTSDCGVPLPASKPKIWSLADTAACKTPPPPPPITNQHAHLQHANLLQSHHPPPSHHHQQPPQHPHWLSGGGGTVNTNSGFALPSSAARYGPGSGFLPSHCQQGFPDVQTDTPPQTPPNMKLPSVAGNLVSVPTGQSVQCQPGSGYGPPSAFLAGTGGFGRPSPSSIQQHVQQQQHQMGVVQSHQQDNTAFKPFYKSTSQAMSGGFVAPV